MGQSIMVRLGDEKINQPKGTEMVKCRCSAISFSVIALLFAISAQSYAHAQGLGKKCSDLYDISKEITDAGSKMYEIRHKDRILYCKLAEKMYAADLLFAQVVNENTDHCGIAQSDIDDQKKTVEEFANNTVKSCKTDP